MECTASDDTTPYAGRHRMMADRAPSVPGYALGEMLGAGGSSRVWAATDGAGQEVAVKVVTAAHADDALVELAVLERIEDPHLVRVREALALPDGAVALVLDLCRGGNLGEAVGARGHLATGELVTILSPIASALGRLHGLGVVHGDLAPGNILLTLDGRPMLADLGVARIIGEPGAELRGTEGFVAPEVLLGAVPGPAADVFALGALAWLCLTGEVPEPAVVRGRLAERLPGLPEQLTEVVEGALRTRPEDRPDADAVAAGLFDSAPPVPLRLSRGGDEVSLLTRRIREAARAEAPAAGIGQRGRRPFGRGRQLALVRPARARVAPAPLAPARCRRVLQLFRVGFRRIQQVLGAGARGVRWALPLVAVFLVVGAVTAGVMAWAGFKDGVDVPAIGRDSGEPTGRSADMPAGVRTTSAPAEVLGDREAPGTNPLVLVQALADARARTWSAGRASGLAAVNAAKSPALEREIAVLAGVERAGQRYVGLSFVVRSANAVTASDREATIRARIDTGAHAITGPRGVERRQATVAVPVLLDLVWTEAGWRIHEVRSTDA